MIERAYLAVSPQGKFGPEEQLLAQELTPRGIPYSPLTLRQLRRGGFAANHATLFAGDVDFLCEALRQLELPVPEPDPYPLALRHHLQRRIWESDMGTEIDHQQEAFPESRFLKSRRLRKSFRGVAVDSDHQLAKILHVPRDEPVYCADIVEWKSEYRVYVVGGEIRAVGHYSGNPNTPLDMRVVRDSVIRVAEASALPCAYGVDFGVLGNGETALVEMNDGFSLGAISIGAKDYTDLILARWDQLVSPVVAAG